QALEGKLHGLDRDVGSLAVERRPLDLARPRAQQPPRHDDLSALFVLELYDDSARGAPAVARFVPPVIKVERADDAPLQNGVTVVLPPGKLHYAAFPRVARAIFDHFDRRARYDDFGKARVRPVGFAGAEIYKEIEVAVRTLSQHGHGRVSCRVGSKAHHRPLVSRVM